MHAVNVGRTDARGNFYSSEQNDLSSLYLRIQVVAAISLDSKAAIMGFYLTATAHLQTVPTQMILLALVLLIATTVVFAATSGTPGKPLFPKPISGCGCVCLVLLAWIFLAGIAIGPIGPSIRYPVEMKTMQTCRTLALAMFQYANDNDGSYPDGTSSTEVFQKLVDGNYISDPAIFFIPLPGKIAAKEGARLKPENIAYDVTSGVNAQSADGVPIVFLTGFRMDYLPDGSAVSLVRPFPSWRANWLSWAWWGRDEGGGTFGGLPIAYKSNNAWFKRSETISTIKAPPVTYSNGFSLITNIVTGPQINAQGYGIVSNVIAPNFDAHGQPFRQLTPTGVLK